MISDERLREAARQAEKNLLDSLPEPENCEATFSPEFKRKMKKLVRRTDHPVRYWLQKAVACILLTILIGGGSVLTFSTEARAAFVGWIREMYENYFVYYFVGEVRNNSENFVFLPSWLPDGYTESFVSELSGQTIMVFEDDNKTQITFGYSKNIGYWKLYVDIENSEVRQVEVLGQIADMYSSNLNEGAKHLVWIDENIDYVFFISANLSEDVIVQIAENINRQ